MTDNLQTGGSSGSEQLGGQPLKAVDAVEPALDGLESQSNLAQSQAGKTGLFKSQSQSQNQNQIHGQVKGQLQAQNQPNLLGQAKVVQAKQPLLPKLSEQEPAQQSIPEGFVLPPPAPLPPGFGGSQSRSKADSKSSNAAAASLNLSAQEGGDARGAQRADAEAEKMGISKEDALDVSVENSVSPRKKVSTVKQTTVKKTALEPPSSSSGRVFLAGQALPSPEVPEVDKTFVSIEINVGNLETSRMANLSDSVDSHEKLSPGGERVPASAGAPAGSGLEEPTDELVGTNYLGKYDLLGVLGAGGMGVIYQARQVFLDRIVAIKMMKNKFASPKARLRFHQEAKAAASLDHPGIVAINDFGIDSEERPYMVMEYVEGLTLADLVKNSQGSVLKVEEALPIFISMLEPLALAHSHGVVHRDIKPSNVMLAVKPTGGVQVKLLDFGIAKLRDIDDNTIQDLTRTGEALGTPLYMSPEQIRSVRVDNRSDLYSFGCVMYMCLTGAPPFVGENKLVTMDKHLSERPLSLREASLGLNFPAELEACVLRCMAKEPEARYQSAQELRQDLIAIACQLGVMTLPPGVVAPRLGQQVSIQISQLTSPPLSPALSQMVTELTSISLAGLDFDPVPQSKSVTGQFYSEPSMYLPVPASQALHQTEGARLPAPAEGGYGRYSDRVISAQAISEQADSRSADVVEVALVRTNRTGLVLIIVGAAIFCLVGLAAVIFLVQHFSSPQTAAGGRESVPAPVVERVVDTAAEKVIEEHTADDEIAHKIKRTPNLTFVFMKEKVTDRGLSYLSKAVMLNQLSLVDSEISPAGLARVPMTKLNLLSLKNCNIDDSYTKVLAGFKNLKNLFLFDNPGFSDASVEPLTKLQYIEGLDYSGTGVSANSLKYLTRYSGLRALQLNRLKLDDHSIAELAKCRLLRILGMARSGLTDKSTPAFSRLSQLPSLANLNLAGNQVGDSVVEVLSKYPSLSTLDLSETQITAKALAKLAGLPSLKVLHLYGCKLTPAEIESFGKARPDVRVTEQPVPVSSDF
ncbi:MAG: protein kinase [Candidatus Obscuribacterales bacterium]|nr:protein kinase [Candidatus Obscuribacterales bacterium]